MPNKRLSMRKIKEVLRLKCVCGLGDQEIAESCKIGRTTVGNYLKRMSAAGLDWDSAAGLSEREIEERLFPRSHPPAEARRPLPDCQYIYDELRGYKKLNLTLGFSHPVSYAVPDGITVETPSQTEIIVKGIDRQKVGQVAAEIRHYRSPEPYKGKGVRYSGEQVVLKEAKKK